MQNTRFAASSYVAVATVLALMSNAAWAQVPAGSAAVPNAPTAGRTDQPSSIPASPMGGLAPDTVVPNQALQETSGLEDIVVTAQKRSENLQNVPIAVSAIGAQQMARLGVNTVGDIKVVVPSLNVTNSAGNVSFSLRGIGSNGIGPGVENPIALYIDGVYYGSPAASLLTLNNVAQIEVLKGPQGTLFGRNATGGLVQVSTKDPGSIATGSANLSYGNYNTVIADAYLAGPLARHLNMDIAVAGTHQGDGYGKNLTTGGGVLQVKHDIALRSKMIFEPSDTTKLTLIADYSDRVDSFVANVVVPGTISGFAPAAGRAPDIDFDATNERTPRTATKAGGVSIRYDQKIGAVNFMSLTAYRRARQDNYFDYDGSGQPLETIQQRQNDRQFSQELQLSSRDRGRFTWLAGAYYYKARADYDPFVFTANDQGVRVTVNNKVGTESFAGYAQGTYEILDGTNLTLGGRYTTEKREAFDGSTSVFIIPLNAQTPATIGRDRSKRFDKFTYRASLDHRFNPEVLGYLSYNRGFKSGGFNAPAPGSAPYRPETLDAYEGGLKMDLFDRVVRLNIAGFYYRYSDLQIQLLQAGAIIIINGGKARDYGVDADLTVKLTNDLRLTSGLNWISPKFTSFPTCLISSRQGGVPSIIGSCAGNQLPLAAKFTGNIGVSYNRNLGFATLDGAINLYHSSGYFTESDNITEQRSFDLLNGSVKLTLPSKISIGIYGKNLFDRRIKNFGSTVPNGTHFALWQAPRTYGVTLGYSF